MPTCNFTIDKDLGPEMLILLIYYFWHTRIIPYELLHSDVQYASVIIYESTVNQFLDIIKCLFHNLHNRIWQNSRNLIKLSNLKQKRSEEVWRIHIDFQKSSEQQRLAYHDCYHENYLIRLFNSLYYDGKALRIV